MLYSHTVVLCLALSAAAFADQVTLKNGDRLSGQIVKSNTKELVLKSEFAGTVSIQWSAIDALASAAPLYVHLTTGETVTGPIAMTGGKFVIGTAQTGMFTAAKDQVKAIESKEEEPNYEREAERMGHPSLLELWAGFIDTGLSLARGNARSTTHSLSANAARVTSRDKISVYFTSLFSRNRINGVSALGSDVKRGGLRYDATFAGRTFAFASSDFEYNQLQNLNLRAVLGPGIGRHIVKDETVVFDLFGGGSVAKEYFFNHITRTSGEIQAGDQLSLKLNKTTQLTQSLIFFPNVTFGGEYRINFDAAAVTQLKKWLGFHITVSDRFLSNPPQPGIKTNDILLTTGFRISFAK